MRKRTIAVVVSSLLLASAAAWAAVVTQDGGFELGTPNSAWDEASTNFGTPLCTVGLCGTGGGTGPRSGSWWAWFGGINGLEVGSVHQDVVIGSGTASLTFWLEVPSTNGDPEDFLAVSIDETEIFRVTGDAAAAYADYAQVTLDVSAFADGGNHTLKFDSTVTSGEIVTNFFVDDVSLDVEEVVVTCASEGYTGTKLLWCRNICEIEHTPAVHASWIHRWVNRYRDLPYCAVEGGGEEEPPQEG